MLLEAVVEGVGLGDTELDLLRVGELVTLPEDEGERLLEGELLPLLDTVVEEVGLPEDD